MKPKLVAAFGALSFVMVVSLALNVVLGQKARSFYLQSQATRLDPLGLKVYPSSIPERRGPVIVFFGDSRAEQWPASERLSTATVVNRGIGNQTTAQMLGRFQEHVASLKPDVIILQAGVNDLKTIPLFPNQRRAIVEACKANLARLIDESSKTGARVIVTTIFPLGEVPLERKPFWSNDVATGIEEVNVYLKTLGTERVTVFDVAPVLKDDRSALVPKYSSDLLHLTPDGYAALNRAMSGLLIP